MLRIWLISLSTIKFDYLTFTLEKSKLKRWCKLAEPRLEFFFGLREQDD